MAKAYWIAHVDVADPEAYEAYRRANGPVFAKYGARFLARGGRSDLVEGRSRTRHVILEFPDYEAAVACYQSDEYRDILKLRVAASEADIVIVEGYDGPQPSSR